MTTGLCTRQTVWRQNIDKRSQEARVGPAALDKACRLTEDTMRDYSSRRAPAIRHTRARHKKKVPSLMERPREKIFFLPPTLMPASSGAAATPTPAHSDVPVAQALSEMDPLCLSEVDSAGHRSYEKPIISSAPQQRPCASSPKAREDRMTPRPAKERRHQNDTKLSATEVPPSSTRKPVRRRMLERKKAAVAVSATSLIPSCSSSVRSVHERKKNAIKKSTRPCVVTAGNSATASANVTGSDAEERKSADTASSGRTRSDDNISSLRGLRLSACSTFKTASSRESPFIDRACPRRLFLQSDSRQGSTVSRGHESDIMTDRTEEYSMCTDSQRRGGEVVSRRRLTVTSPSSSTKRTEQSRKAYLIELAKREKSWHRERAQLLAVIQLQRKQLTQSLEEPSLEKISPKTPQEKDDPSTSKTSGAADPESHALDIHHSPRRKRVEGYTKTKMLSLSKSSPLSSLSGFPPPPPPSTARVRIGASMSPNTPETVGMWSPCSISDQEDGGMMFSTSERTHLLGKVELQREQAARARDASPGSAEHFLGLKTPLAHAKSKLLSAGKGDSRKAVLPSKMSGRARGEGMSKSAKQREGHQREVDAVSGVQTCTPMWDKVEGRLEVMESNITRILQRLASLEK